MSSQPSLAERYANLVYATAVEKVAEPDGQTYFVATHPDLPGCIADGDTEEEAIQELNDARKAYIKSLIQWNQPIPTPRGEFLFGNGTNTLIRFPTPKPEVRVERSYSFSSFRRSTPSTLSKIVLDFDAWVNPPVVPL